MARPIGEAHQVLCRLQQAVGTALLETSKHRGDEDLVLAKLAEVVELANGVLADYGPPPRVEEPALVEQPVATWLKPAPKPEVHDPAEAVPTLASISQAHARALQHARRGGNPNAIAGAASEIKVAAETLLRMCQPASEPEPATAKA